MPILPFLIPIIAIVMGIGIGMLAIYLNYKKRKEIFAMYHQERMAAIDKGIELPPLPDAFFKEDSSSPAPRRRLLVGLVWLFLGLGFAGALLGAGDSETAWFGLIPIGIGLANLIYWFVAGRQEAELLEESLRAKLAEKRSDRIA